MSQHIPFTFHVLENTTCSSTAVRQGTYLGLHTAAFLGGALGAGGELGLVPSPFPGPPLIKAESPSALMRGSREELGAVR